LIQLLIPILDRGCQSADVVDNITGLLIGLVIGTGLRVLEGEVGGLRNGGGSEQPRARTELPESSHTTGTEVAPGGDLD